MNNKPNTTPEPITPPAGAFSSLEALNAMRDVAKTFCHSTLVPPQYRGAKNIGNVMIALDLAARTGANPLTVMRNLNAEAGTPSWSAQFLIARVNSCGRFEPLRYKLTGQGTNRDASPGRPRRAATSDSEARG